jgi:YbgC/YbaW family acyl-CoA thioester hydrolase
MDRSDFSFFHTLRVRWAEVDMQAIVFNGHYLTYFDVAFTEYWRATGLPDVLAQAAAGQELFARKAGIDYLAPARFDDVLDIGVRCASLGRSSLRANCCTCTRTRHCARACLCRKAGVRGCPAWKRNVRRNPIDRAHRCLERRARGSVGDSA